jgi:hypothetical protein
MTRLPSPGFEALLAETAARESSLVRVQAAADLPGGIEAYKVYVDGNVRGTPSRLSEYKAFDVVVIPVVPGEHRVVVRDADIHNPSRAESNTIHVTVAYGQELHFVIGFKSGALELSCQPGF